MINRDELKDFIDSRIKDYLTIFIDDVFTWRENAKLLRVELRWNGEKFSETEVEISDL